MRLATRSKFGNKHTAVDGIVFASALEARVYQRLKLRQKARDIGELRLQMSFLLLDGFTDGEGTKHRPIRYVADFYYVAGTGQETVCDAKGKVTREFAIKRKLFLSRYPDIRFEVVTE